MCENDRPQNLEELLPKLIDWSLTQLDEIINPLKSIADGEGYLTKVRDLPDKDTEEIKNIAEQCLAISCGLRGELTDISHQKTSLNDHQRSAKAIQLLMAAQALDLTLGNISTGAAAKAQAGGTSTGVGGFFKWLLGVLGGKLSQFLNYLWNIIAHLATPKGWKLGGEVSFSALFAGGKAKVEIEFG